MASIARIDELKKKFDENPRRYFAPLANEFRKAGEIEQAIMICEEFLPQQPGHMSGHIVYGQALFEAGRLEESRTVFETALTLDPENLIALRHLGDIARGQGALEAARRWYDRVLEADPRNDEIQGLIASLDSAPSGSTADQHAGTSGTAVSPFAPPQPADEPTRGTVAPPPLPEPLDLEVSGDVAESMPETVRMPVVKRAPIIGERAEGLEPVEFTPPDALDRAHDLGSSLEPGEFIAPAAPVEPLAGLEETSIGAFERAVPDGGPPLPMLDTSEPAATSAPALDAEEGSSPARSDEIPAELPPSVIAAEAELMDLGEPIPTVSSAVPDRGGGAPAPPAPFVTETMAELFLKQGFRDQAANVYRQLLAASPDDGRLRQLLSALQPAAPAAAGDSVRDFLSRLATLRPGERAAAAAPPSDDDFSGRDAAPPAPRTPSPRGPEPAPPAAATPRPTPSSVTSTGVERGAVPRGAAGGSIDALFGNRSAGTSEDSAASALAQAFGGAAPEPAPSISGRPARAAAGELSLDSVFRDSSPRPPRSSQSFSFDQFFSPESASSDRAAPAAPAPQGDGAATSQPAERSEDDIEQFNSWLQGLKPK